MSVILVLMTAACGTKTTPSPAHAMTGQFGGIVSDSAIGQNAGWVWQLSQSGTYFSGTVQLTSVGSNLVYEGIISGTLTGDGVTFTVTVPSGGLKAQSFYGPTTCSVTINGSGSVQESKPTTIAGTYTGTTSCRQAILNGAFQLNRSN